MSFFCSRRYYFSALCPLHGWEVFEFIDHDVPPPPTLCEQDNTTPLVASSVTYAGFEDVQSMCVLMNELDARLDAQESTPRAFQLSTGDVFTTLQTGFADAAHAVWPGTTTFGVPGTFQAAVGIITSAGNTTVRVYDKTNSVVIAGPATTANDALKLLALTYNGNASAGAAVWALQVHTNNVLFLACVGGLTATVTAP